MTTFSENDSWSAGPSYERFMGRWSRRIASAFLEWLAPDPELRWLEVGCGTGALSEAILKHGSPKSLLAVDPSPEFIEFARRKLPDPRLTFLVGDALRLPPVPDRIDVAVSGLVLNFIAEPRIALQAIHRRLQPDGILALYVWDYAGKMEMLRYFWDSAVALNPAAAAQDEGNRFPICQPEALEQLCRQAGFHDIQVSGVQATLRFADFEDYWTPFLGGQGPAPGYLARLNPADRRLLEDRLRAALPFQADGSLRLAARAWAVRAAS